MAVTFAAGLWTLLLAFGFTWGGAVLAAAIMALLALAVAFVGLFLRRASAVWTLLLATAGAIVQGTLASGSVFDFYWEQGEQPGLAFAATFATLGTAPAVAGVLLVAFALTERVEAESRRGVVLIALTVLGAGSFLFWLFGLVALEGATTGRDAADNAIDDLFFAFLYSGPALLYSAAAAIVVAAVGPRTTDPADSASLIAKTDN